ncbi:dienelactone hydrolase family protein [Arthrobacter sp. ISL-85]|uniref:dienelactone hydrolase family protein n=1 Tax=Arthrobacter sp. ISL-85 TaxID=2819115 RepID=UPI001BE6B2F2|nr:dienelactone hydrolase family protein [Arthrobacter sp. ISL-85]MBT2565390.1 dienelactone hydrolase family protein [Arthrobacter sp. ISL-85]
MTNVDLSAVSAAAGGSSSLHGYLAVPEGPGPFPGVVMIHEVFGLDDQTRRHADRLARAGYLTLALDLYSDGGPRRCLVGTMRAMAARTGRPFTDLATARTWLAESELGNGKTGVIGFCMGGAFALLVARDGFDAASVNYGRLPGKRQEDLEEALRGACPIVANYGGADKSLKGAAARLESALDRLGIEHSVKEFPGAGHTFLNDEVLGPAILRPLMRVMGVGPDPESAPEAWQRIEDHFGRYLKD